VTDSPQIPEQWLSLLIGEIADVVAGGTPKASDPANFAEPGTQIAWLTPADLSKYSEKYISHGARDLSKTGYESSSAKLMPAGTLLFSSRAPIGYVAVAANEVSTNQGFKNFVLPAEVDSSYAYYFLRSIRDVAESMGTGTTFKEISGASAKKLPFTLPPLAEQKVIADKLDTLLAQVENTKARLERIPQILKRFRQSVLAAAVSGRLTGGTFVNLGTLKNVADIVSGVAFKKAQYSNFGSKLLQIANVGYGDTKWDSVSYIPSSLADDFSTYSLAKGDIVMALNRPITNDTLKVAAVSVDDLPATLYQRVARIRSKPELLNSRYLFLLMQGPDFRKKVELNLKGSDQPYLNTSSLGTFEIYAPELEKQTDIVHQVEQLFAHADRIEQQVNNALARVNNLTQSILAKAFRGELTEQWRKDNPELISGENSAEALLERIKAERAATKPAKKTRKKMSS